VNRGVPAVIHAAVCPSSPLLATELSGRGDVLPELRTACAEAVTGLLAGAMTAPGTARVPAGQVLYADAPLGVGYFVAVLDPPDRDPVSRPRA